MQPYALSLHDALPILNGNQFHSMEVFTRRWYQTVAAVLSPQGALMQTFAAGDMTEDEFVTTAKDRKSTRLNSSHPSISYAVFCLKKHTFTVIGSCGTH